jgi:glycosyltransferase involved in cell wall biosynthesis
MSDGNPDKADPAPRARPLVSVILPCFNTRDYIAEAIDSVLSQDYPNKELIVVDDGSTDGTLDVVRGYGDRIRLLQCERGGPAAARNAGIAAARGEYLAFNDSDDVWLPGRLTAQVADLEAHPDIAANYVDIIWWFRGEDGDFHAPELAQASRDEYGQPLVQIDQDQSGWLYHRLLFDSVMSTITVLLRKSLIDQIGPFDETLKRGEDYDMWLRASRVTQIHKLAYPGALYRRHGMGSMTTFSDRNYELQVLERAIERWGNVGPDGSRADPSRLRRRLARSSFAFARYHLRRGDPRTAVQSFYQSLRRRPFWGRAWIYLALAAAKTALITVRGSTTGPGHV